MNRNLHNAMMAQYDTPKVSGDGLVAWDGGVKCVMPSVKLMGAATQGTLTGSNILPITHSGTTTFGVTLTNNQDGSITLNGTCTRSYNFEQVITVPEDGTYYLCDFSVGSFPDNAYARTQIYEASTGNIEVLNKAPNNGVASATLKAGSPNLRIRIDDGWTYENCVLRPMLSKSPITAYEPYCGGIPAPNPGYPIQPVCNDGAVQACGKNLFKDMFPESYTASVSVTGLCGSRFPTDKEIALISDKTVTYSALIDNTKNGGKSNVVVWLRNSEGTYVLIKSGTFVASGDKGVSSVTVNFAEYKDITYVIFGASLIASDGKPISISQRMVELGDTATPYTPYWDGGTAQAPELWAIPGTDIRDEWDCQTGHGVRRIKKMELDGSESWSLISQSGNYVRFWMTSGTAGYQEPLACFSDRFQVSNYGGINSVWISGTPTDGLLNINIDVGIIGEPTLDAFKQYLQAQKQAGTPVTVWFLLAKNRYENFTSTPQKLTMPPGYGQIIQVGGSVPDFPIEAKYLTHAGGAK